MTNKGHRWSNNKLNSKSLVEFKEIIKNNTGYAGVARDLGYRCRTKHIYVIVRERIEKENIDISHFIDKVTAMHRAQEIDLKEFFICGTVVRSNHALKRKILKNNICEYKCQECGNTGEWNNKKLTLQVHHINGLKYDNRPENLIFLCPNCHSQTKNFTGGNKKNFMPLKH